VVTPVCHFPSRLSAAQENYVRFWQDYASAAVKNLYLRAAA